MPLLFRLMALALMLAPLLAGPAGAQAPERRFALVIGNSEYKAGQLPTAANDAGLVAETLRTAGFDVAGARDIDGDTLRRSIREFLDKVSAAGPEAVSFIYLAGYGLQFEGENYILPIDATIARDEDIPLEAVRISDLMRPLSGTPGGVKIVVVDAARQHPFTPAGSQLASGLALVEPDPGMLIAFNTAPGSVAPVEDGPYGAFARALAEMIATGGLGLDDVFSRLRLRVNEATNGVAVPWYASKIAQPFVFTEATADAPPPPQQVVGAVALQSQSIREFRDDQEAYIAALERDTIAGYEEFIAAFPDSPHARRARALLAVRREALTWRRAVAINTPEAYWSYLERYPQGAHVADAERRLARLAAADDPPPGFLSMAFADVPPPPPDEVVYLTQPEIVFDDPGFAPPPPLPVFFCPPEPAEFVALPPPPPPVGAFFLPAPVVPFFSGPRPWVRAPSFVRPPPRAPVQQLTLNNGAFSNHQRPGGVGLMSPALPGAVVNRVNNGSLKPPPPATRHPHVPPVQTASRHPGVGVLGTAVALPPRVHGGTPGGGFNQRRPDGIPGGLKGPGGSGGPGAPNTAGKTPGGAPGGGFDQRRPNGFPGPGGPPAPNTAARTPGGGNDPRRPGGIQGPKGPGGFGGSAPNTAARTPGGGNDPRRPGGIQGPKGPGGFGGSAPNTAARTPGGGNDPRRPGGIQGPKGPGSLGGSVPNTAARTPAGGFDQRRPTGQQGGVHPSFTPPPSRAPQQVNRQPPPPVHSAPVRQPPAPPRSPPAAFHPAQPPRRRFSSRFGRWSSRRGRCSRRPGKPRRKGGAASTMAGRFATEAIRRRPRRLFRRGR